jgi:hypothetical protein
MVAHYLSPPNRKLNGTQILLIRHVVSRSQKQQKLNIFWENLLLGLHKFKDPLLSGTSMALLHKFGTS